jgi:hypothetical protein
MKQKLVFLIALILALSQGLAAQEVSGSGFIDPTGEYFEAYVGQSDTHTIKLQYVVNGVVRLNATGQQEPTSLKGTNDFSVSISNRFFTATLENVMVASGSTTTTYIATVEVTYRPTIAGEHSATVYLNNASGQSVASKNLIGIATVLKGDADGDGLVTVADVTAIIDYLLSGDPTDINLAAADVDKDGKVTIADASTLIDLILGVPDTRLCTFIIVSNTNGVNYEYMIDENTKVNIVDGKLRIRGSLRNNGTRNPHTISFSLENLSQLRYVERTVTFDNKLAGVCISEEDCEILKSLKP